MYRDTEMKEQTILSFIQQHKTGVVPALNRLESYYVGKNDILKRPMSDPDRPNNRVAHPFATYITDLLTGYFIGEPVSYDAPEEYEQAFAELKAILTYNEEQEENSKLANFCSIYGYAYEVLYVAEDGNPEFIAIDAREGFIVYDNSIRPKPAYAVRYVQTGEDYTVEVYTPKEIKTYTAGQQLTHMNFVDSATHDFGEVPFIVYQNNDYEMGDFENQIPLIDAYDKFVSDSLNDFEYFSNAYLGFYGVEIPDEEITTMKKERLLYFPEGAKAEFITKDLHGGEVQNHLGRTENDIHKFAKVPNSNDENFANNASGVAQQYKLLGTENLTVMKERKFKKALQQRLKLILNFLAFKSNNSLDWRSINITFTRNLPTDGLAMAEYINKLRGLVSNKTLIGWLPEIEDVDRELEKLEEERKSNPIYSFGVGEEDEQE